MTKNQVMHHGFQETKLNQGIRFKLLRLKNRQQFNSASYYSSSQLSLLNPIYSIYSKLI
jgi:hypothetical protein